MTAKVNLLPDPPDDTENEDDWEQDDALGLPPAVAAGIWSIGPVA